MKECISCKKRRHNSKFLSIASKSCIDCKSMTYYERNKEKFHQRFILKYYSNLEENRKINAEQRRKWRASNPDKVKIESKKKYDKVKADPIKYQKQLESVRKQKAQKKYGYLEKAYRDRSRENLTDNYIKRTLLDRHTGVLKFNDITDEMVAMKRKMLLLKRQTL